MGTEESILCKWMSQLGYPPPPRPQIQAGQKRRAVLKGSMDLAYGVFLTVMDVLTQRWKQRNLPSTLTIGEDVKDQLIIVTGPTSGIGEQLASNLAKRGAYVVLACRNLSKGQALKKKLEDWARRSGCEKPKLEVSELDVSSFASIRQFSKRWAGSGRKLNCLINNAGIFSINAKRCLTVEGIEAHMGTNYLGAFLLTLLLLPALQKAGTPEKPARIVLVSSIVHYCCIKLKRDDMNLDRSFSPLRAYGISKYAQVAFAAEMRRRLPANGSIAIFACHPGECTTDIVRTLPAPLQRLYNFLLPPLLISADRGGSSSLFCATSNPIIANLRHLDPGACYIGCGCRIEAPAAYTTNPDEGQWLWDWSSRTVKLEPAAHLKRQ